MLAAYLEAEPHDALLLSFNLALVPAVRQCVRVPVRSLPPTFFRYPAAVPAAQPRLELLHVGMPGPPSPSPPRAVDGLAGPRAVALSPCQHFQP